MCYQEDISAVHFGFCLAGHYTGALGKQREPFTLRAGEHYLFFARDQNGCAQMATGVRQLCVSLMINPELFLSYFGDDCSLLPEMLQGIVHKDTDACFFQVERITADMHRALRQIIDCPYTGASRKLYVESRCLELVAYQLQQFSGLKAVSALAAGRGHVHPAEKNRIEKVRSLLLDNLDAPPNLDDLAEAAGMSHPKLNRCFRQMFGTTVMEGVLGIDRTFGTNLYINLQYFFSWTSEAEYLINDTWAHGITYDVHDSFLQDDLEAGVRGIVGFTGQGWSFEPYAEYRLADDWLFQGSLLFFEGSESGTYGQFDHNDMVTLRVRYSF